jgi:hypothetical protein
MDEDGSVREDVKVPNNEPELAAQIQAGFDADESLAICVMTAMGQERVVSSKVM